MVVATTVVVTVALAGSAPDHQCSHRLAACRTSYSTRSLQRAVSSLRGMTSGPLRATSTTAKFVAPALSANLQVPLTRIAPKP